MLRKLHTKKYNSSFFSITVFPSESIEPPIQIMWLPPFNTYEMQHVYYMHVLV